MAKKIIHTVNGCYYTEPSVHPSNWNTKKANLKDTWYIHYSFHDPAHRDKYKYGKVEQVKGLASFKTLAERQEAVKILLEDIKKDLEIDYWNPITKQFMNPYDDFDYTIPPSTQWIVALQEVLKRVTYADSTKRDCRSIVNRLQNIAKTLNLESFKISEIRKRHIKSVLNYAASIDGNYSAHRFNAWRTYLSMLFSELCDYETIDVNPCKEIKKAKHVKKARIIPTKIERKRIDEYLRKHNYPFWRFVNIFFNSGARIIELLRLKVKDVDLVKQEFKVLVKKGNSYREELHVIKDNVLPIWQEVIKSFHEGEAYVFSDGLVPGLKSNPINNKNIERRWRVLIKEKLKIDVDLYALKHAHTDEVAAMVGIEIAAKHNAHSIGIAKKHYAVNEDDRIREIIKKLPISLS